MYWNLVKPYIENGVEKININMRCIEICTDWGGISEHC